MTVWAKIIPFTKLFKKKSGFATLSIVDDVFFYRKRDNPMTIKMPHLAPTGIE